MTDNNNSDLESILSDFEQQKPTLERAAESMSNDHLEKATTVFWNEYQKRLDPLKNVGSMNESEFAELRRRYGV